MNSCERVKAALTFSGPDKIPVMNFMSLNSLIFQSDVYLLSTLHSKNWNPGWNEGEEGLFPHFKLEGYPIKRWKKPEWAKEPKYEDWQNQPHEEIDEWGCIWERTGKKTTMGHPGRPSLPDWSKLDEYIDKYFPDPEDKSRYMLTIRAGKVVAINKYRMIIPDFGPFGIASNMRGFENFMADHIQETSNLEYLLEQLTENLINTIKMFIKLGGKPHGVLMYDDLGTQDRPFMSPSMFKKFYEPVYGKIINFAHQNGLEFHLHSCGKIDKLIPYFIDWGLDALEFDSPRMTGYPDLKPFRGKIMFWGCVNIQSIYVNGTPEECEREVWHMMRNLGTQDGGFGAYLYPQDYHIQAPKENVKAFKNGIRKFGTYSKIPAHWWDAPIPEAWKDHEVPPLPPINP